MTTENELLPCPFCGAAATVHVNEPSFQIVGCDTDPFETMLCPRPRMIIYRDESGVFNYKWWNRRGGKHV